MLDAEVFKEFKKKEMILRPLFFLQEKLDEKIKSRFTYDAFLEQEHFEKKILAFRVEVAELLNALRYHKYWSTKAATEQDRDHILEEYVDGLHFLLSIGIEKGVLDYEYKGIFDEHLTAEDLTFVFDRLMTINFRDMRKEDYYQMLEMYLKLGELLIFDWNEIKTAYVNKNLTNQERQENGY